MKLVECRYVNKLDFVKCVLSSKQSKCDLILKNKFEAKYIDYKFPSIFNSTNFWCLNHHYATWTSSTWISFNNRAVYSFVSYSLPISSTDGVAILTLLLRIMLSFQSFMNLNSKQTLYLVSLP